MYQPPSERSLPRWGDPRKYAYKGVQLDGRIAIGDLPRISEVAANGEGYCRANLTFGVDEENRRGLEGNLEASVQLTCQRCLEPVEVAVTCDLEIAVVWSEEQARVLPRHLEPWIVAEEGAADLYDIIDEELLLALPQVAYHKHQCLPGSFYTSESPEQQTVEETSTDEKNPFQVLEQLKGTPKK